MKFSCPQCDHALEACRSFVGFAIRCPSCRHPVTVPQADSPFVASATTPIRETEPTPEPADQPDAAPVPEKKRLSKLSLGISLAFAAATLLGGIGLIVNNAGSETPPPSTSAPLANPSAEPSPVAADQPPSPVATPSPEETAQSK